MSLDEILKKLDTDTLARMKRKIPSWFARGAGRDNSVNVQDAELIFPTAISTQQCSGESAALYKASIASKAVMGAPSPRIADLTGGMGVDSWAFSKCFDKVLYNDANPELAAAAEHNFKILGCDNIIVSNKLLEPGNLHDILGDFRPDIIFLDPARRSSTGKKVFLLEDCQPDVLTIKEDLISACPLLLLKLSPMADISMILHRLGTEVTDVHVVAFNGECKELLLMLKAGGQEAASLTIHEDGVSFTFPHYYAPDAKASTNPDGNSGILKDTPEPGQILYEPGKSITKAGLFDFPCTLGYSKLAQHTHLYIAPAKGLPGKYFKIEKVLPLQSRTIKEIAKKGLAAEVSCHNVPITAEDLRKRLHLSHSPASHIFAAGCDSSRYLILATRVL